MSIKCGHCKEYHESIAELRVCAGVQPIGVRYDPERAIDAAEGSNHPAGGSLGASEKQMSYILSLRESKGIEGNIDSMTRSEASVEIARLLEMPRPKPVHLSNPILDRDKVREGRYAVEMDGVLKFYKVDKPTEGRWSGYTFVKVQASDDLYLVRGAGATKVLAAIAEDPQAAMLRYGRELGQCGHCGRTLTNEESRMIGIGPVCRSKMGGWI